MRKTDFSKIMKLSVILVLIAAMALCIISCGNNTDSETEAAATSGETSADASNGTTDSSVTDASSGSVTEGKYTLTVTVVDDKGESKDFEIKTDADNLGDALLDSGLVEGDMEAYGLYIKVVNGIRADYDLDKAYWALSKDGEYLMTGADSTPIADGEHYELTYTK